MLSCWRQFYSTWTHFLISKHFYHFDNDGAVAWPALVFIGSSIQFLIHACDGFHVFQIGVLSADVGTDTLIEYNSIVMK